MKTLLVLFFSLSIVLKLDAQSLSHQISSDSILIGNYFIYQVILEDIDADLNEVDLSRFEIISGPNISQSVSIINGEKSSSRTLSWYLKPNELGQYFIAPIYFTEGEEVFEADAIELNVFENPNGVIIEPHQTNEMDDFFNLMRPPFMKEIEPKEVPSEKKKPKRELKKG